eukprot:1159564-Pelagomonas_calceolata.AAC.6
MSRFAGVHSIASRRHVFVVPRVPEEAGLIFKKAHAQAEMTFQQSGSAGIRAEIQACNVRALRVHFKSVMR